MQRKWVHRLSSIYYSTWIIHHVGTTKAVVMYGFQLFKIYKSDLTEIKPAISPSQTCKLLWKLMLHRYGFQSTLQCNKLYWLNLVIMKSKIKMDHQQEIWMNRGIIIFRIVSFQKSNLMLISSIILLVHFRYILLLISTVRLRIINYMRIKQMFC